MNKKHNQNWCKNPQNIHICPYFNLLQPTSQERFSYKYFLELLDLTYLVYMTIFYEGQKGSKLSRRHIPFSCSFSLKRKLTSRLSKEENYWKRGQNNNMSFCFILILPIFIIFMNNLMSFHFYFPNLSFFPSLCILSTFSFFLFP